MNPNDTIVACTTPSGYSSIAVIRVSGGQAVTLLHKIFKSTQLNGEYSSHHVYHGHVVDPETNEVVDTALAVLFKSPNSYTGEDVVEISCHGNPLIVDRVVRTLNALGGRTAQRGEFTRRALINGKIDLIQAEAVLDTVNATCEQARRLAILQYEGKLSERIYDIRSKIIDSLFLVEAEIDFPEDEDIEYDPATIKNNLRTTVDEIDELLSGAAVGVKIKSGYRILITGRANVGKSTLFNRLVGCERAIVHEKPGTTRDYIEEDVQMRDIHVLLYDTAGMLSKATGPDEIAQQRTKALIHDADLVLMMFDGSEPMNEEDIFLYNLVKHKPKLLVVNKIDLNVRLTNESILSDSIKISAKTGKNISTLQRAVRDALLPHNFGGDVIITRHRHIDTLNRARACLIEAKNAPTIETMAYEMHCALNEIGELTGKTLRKEILDRIFEEFCIGK
ncbi:MAG: tRNA uridine-5-carboxymethylaminomethyl(34) synthesis GTPase MnmE [candidate division WOR-3 bacterium]|nr:MAG: tRNA uridine-5-carboxymethylaminomethyl(34) synthesis GTPase MnmE [candidate division WOR-3 bacterium]